MRPAARRVAPTRPAAAILWPTAGERLPAGPVTVSWEDVGADGYTLLAGDAPGESRYHGSTAWRAGTGPVLRGSAPAAQPHELVACVVEGLPRVARPVYLRLWTIWLGEPCRCVDVRVEAHEGRGRSRLARVATAAAVEIQPAGRLRARAMRRAAGIEREVREGRERWGSNTDMHARARARCTCPAVDPAHASAWLAEGCAVHCGEPGRAEDLDARNARARLDALLAKGASA